MTKRAVTKADSSGSKKKATKRAAKPKAAAAPMAGPRQYALGYADSDTFNWGPIAMKAFTDSETGRDSWLLSIAGDTAGGGGDLEKDATAMTIVSDALLNHVHQSGEAGEKIRWTVVVAPITAAEFGSVSADEDEGEGVDLDDVDLASLRRRPGAETQKIVVGG